MCWTRVTTANIHALKVIQSTSKCRVEFEDFIRCLAGERDGITCANAPRLDWLASRYGFQETHIFTMERCSTCTHTHTSIFYRPASTSQHGKNWSLKLNALGNVAGSTAEIHKIIKYFTKTHCDIWYYAGPWWNIYSVFFFKVAGLIGVRGSKECWWHLQLCPWALHRKTIC